MTVNSRVIKTFLAWTPAAADVPLTNGLRVQILPTIEDLPQARKYQFAAFITSESLLVVWDDDPAKVMNRATSIEKELMKLVWHTAEAGEEYQDASSEKDPAVDVSIDSESGETVPDNRPTNLMNTVLVAFTLIIVIALLGLACRSLAIEIAVDKSYLRLAFLSLVPVQIFFTLVRYHPAQLPDIVLLTLHLVLRPSHRWLRGTMYRPRAADAGELEVLFGPVLAATAHADTAACHGAVPRVQRRPGLGDRPNSPLNQASHLNVRATRRHGQHAHQRRRTTNHRRGRTTGPHRFLPGP